MKTEKQLIEAASKFLSANASLSIKPLGAGHINDSFLVELDGKQYVLQAINHQIFKRIDDLQDNILRVTSHIRNKLSEKGVADIERKVLTFLPSTDGTSFYKDEEGIYWRMMEYIKDNFCYNNIDEKLAYKAGRAFGEFQEMLSDLPAPPLFEVIPNFHNMESRLETFRIAVKNNHSGRLSKVQNLVDEIEKRAEDMCRPEQLHREGKLPKRINHCDTKVSNVLFDAQGEVLCVIDLDTVMPGYVLSDFGDFMRTGANNGDEDDKDLSRVSINMSIFEAYTKGYLETATFLLPIEIENLAFGAKLLTYMQTVRFLADYIDGDTYYKIHYPEHNIDRSLAQFKLLQSMEENFDKMQEIVTRK